ncbi:hypothetical protein EPIR_2043 [Erwinia piriflorinigrans CFBP 5888]|uniref:Uncharacterized protein n=1 Tax=Erwinia piriflorinigrans CFBP 5888 TaxID=1161919 RepID=V5Z8Y2_9GAMM|nr:hypothetical protein EPIR_2043 [Erwinia piriflorinigrans CFBP 5888]
MQLAPFILSVYQLNKVEIIGVFYKRLKYLSQGR